MSGRDELLMQALSDAGAQCGECGDEPGDRACPDCERARAWYVEAIRAAGWAPRAEVLGEAQAATVAWLTKRAAQEYAAARQEEERRATARARHREERGDLIGWLATKVSRGAVREFLDAVAARPPRAEVEREVRAAVADDLMSVAAHPDPWRRRITPGDAADIARHGLCQRYGGELPCAGHQHGGGEGRG